MEIGSDISGLDKALKTVENLGNAEQREFKKAAKKNTRRALKPIEQAAKAGAPVASGRLKKAIRIKAWRTRDRGEIGFKVIVNPGTSRDDPKGAYYGMMQEGGYIDAKGTYHPGKHFLTNAYKANAKQAANAAAAGIIAAVDSVAK